MQRAFFSLVYLALFCSCFIGQALSLCGTPTESELCYWAFRQKLVDQEQQLDLGHQFILTAQELSVQEHLDQLRTQMNAKWPITASLNFRVVKSEIEQSKLYKIFFTMPKGAILHLHAIQDSWFLIKNATYRPDCWTSFEEKTFFFGNKAPGSSWNRTIELRASWPKGAANFDQVLLNFTQFETPPIEISEDEMWVQFDNKIDVVSALTKNPEVQNFSIWNAFDQHAAQNIQHIEMRWGVGRFPERASLFLDLLEKWNSNQPVSRQISLRIIGMIDRADNVSDAWTAMKRTVDLQQEEIGRKYLIGFDFVDEEDRYHKLYYYSEDFVKIAQYTTKNGYPPLQYYFHSGETDYNFQNTSNLYDAVMLGSRRIGHGLALRDHPLLEQIVKDNGIAIEVCPISNQLLRNVGDLRTHPAVGMIRRGLPITLSPDDPSIYGYIGNTNDFVAAYLAWGLNLKEVKQLCYNSLSFSGLSPTERTFQLELWEQKWDLWIKSVLLLAQN